MKLSLGRNPVAKLGPKRTCPYELALQLYEHNGGYRKTTRAMAALGITNPYTFEPYSYYAVRDAILYAQWLKDRQESNEGEVGPG